MSSGETIRSLALAALMTATVSVAGCHGSVGYTAPVGDDGYGPELVCLLAPTSSRLAALSHRFAAVNRRREIVSTDGAATTTIAGS